jgi:solute:Na+ symporter, SSS family
VVPVVARELLPAFVYAAFVGAIISAILSTVDSTLLTASGIMSHNLLVPIAKITEESKKLLVARAGVLLFGVIAYSLALTAEGVYALVEQASAFGSSGAFVVICFGLFSTFGGPAAALLTLIAGVATYVTLAFLDFSYPYLLSLLLSLVVYLSVTMLEKSGRTVH